MSKGDKIRIAGGRFAAILISGFFCLAPNSPYTLQDFQVLANLAQNMATYLETVIKKDLPDADTFHRYIEKNGHTITDFRHAMCKKTAKLLKKIKGRYILIFDETYEPYYGKKKDKWVHEYKHKKGSTGSYKFLCMHLLASDGTRIFLDAMPVSVLSNRVTMIAEMIKFAKKHNDKILCILFDRGFYDSKIIEVLNLLHVNYMMLVPKIGNIPKLLESNRSTEFTVNGYMVNKKATTDITVLRDEKFVWVFASNCKFILKKNMIVLYKKRWNIETGFRVCDEARIKTKSRRIEVRYFVFLCSIVMYNLWKEVYPKITFKRFIQEMTSRHIEEESLRRGILLGLGMSIYLSHNGKNNGFASQTVLFDNALPKADASP